MARTITPRPVPPPTTPLGKMEWGNGPWVSERDRLEWRANRMPCLIIRNAAGALCGYVAVPPGHPWHGQQHREIPATAHSGLSYAGPCHGLICHKPLPGEPADVWWVGFDCTQPCDYQPAIDCRTGKHLDAHIAYRPMSYVTEQVQQLALRAHDAWVDFENNTPATAFYACRPKKRKGTA